ncbi:unnamed protein product [Phytophthora lilii]|uniref:Unnamed protein product n=1 Tax=Phytophthora lilii TaxID=2077276 RepID=A0A9W6X4A8_9STRA|nr:unnamed protein product [Phytophthora lilii]
MSSRTTSRKLDRSHLSWVVDPRLPRDEPRSAAERRRPRTGDDAPDRDADERSKWARAQVAFVILKNKIATAPVLKHFDPERIPVIVMYASKWAISAALMQEHDGVCMPVTFTSRTLKPNELNYCREGSAGAPSNLECLLYAARDEIDQGLDATLNIGVADALTRPSRPAGNWAALLSPWTLELVKYTRGEDEILGTIAASITPRENVDSILSSIAPKKRPREAVTVFPPTVEADEELLVVSFDGSAHVKRDGGACSAIVWKLPDWTVVAAESRFMPDLTVNEAEYQGLLLLRSWPTHEFKHVKRDWNQSADRVASAALQRQEGAVVTLEADRQDLVGLNRLPELLLLTDASPAAHVAAATRSQTRRRAPPAVLQSDVVQHMRAERIGQAQSKEKWIEDLKAYLNGALHKLSVDEAQACSKIAADYELDVSGLLLYCPRTTHAGSDRDLDARLVVPETLQQDVLHHYHTSLEGGHQEIWRTYQLVRAHPSPAGECARFPSGLPLARSFPECAALRGRVYRL